MYVYRLMRYNPDWDDGRGGYDDVDCELHLDRENLDLRAEQLNEGIVATRLVKHEQDMTNWRQHKAEHDALQAAGFRDRPFWQKQPAPPESTARGEGRWPKQHYMVEEIEVLP